MEDVVWAGGVLLRDMAFGLDGVQVFYAFEEGMHKRFLLRETDIDYSWPSGVLERVQLATGLTEQEEKMLRVDEYQFNSKAWDVVGQELTCFYRDEIRDQRLRAQYARELWAPLRN